MALHFIVDEITHPLVSIGGAEAHHAAAVRRVRVAEAVTLGDGRGTWARGSVVSVAPREVVVQIDSAEVVPPPSPRVILVQALAKGDRDELAVQMSTELGVDQIVPWQAARSISRWDAAKALKGRARWSAIAREAAKQAHRAWIPEVTELATTATVKALASDHDVLILDPTGAQALSGVVFATGRDVVLVVGPEGGISDEELAAFEAAGARRIRLGDSILRTSTAGPAAIAVVSANLGRW